MRRAAAPGGAGPLARGASIGVAARRRRPPPRRAVARALHRRSDAGARVRADLPAHQPARRAGDAGHARRRRLPARPAGHHVRPLVVAVVTATVQPRARGGAHLRARLRDRRVGRRQPCSPSGSAPVRTSCGSRRAVRSHRVVARARTCRHPVAEPRVGCDLFVRTIALRGSFTDRRDRRRAHRHGGPRRARDRVPDPLPVGARARRDRDRRPEPGRPAARRRRCTGRARRGRPHDRLGGPARDGRRRGRARAAHRPARHLQRRSRRGGPHRVPADPRRA